MMIVLISIHPCCLSFPVRSFTTVPAPLCPIRQMCLIVLPVNTFVSISFLNFSTFALMVLYLAAGLFVREICLGLPSTMMTA